MANMVNARFAWSFTPPPFFGIQMWHLSSLPYIFTPQYLHICDIFARRKFVQIHFFA